MRRFVPAVVCIVAVTAGFLIPVIAFGQSDPGRQVTVSAPGIVPNQMTADIGGVDPARMLHLLAGLIVIAAREDPGVATSTSTASESVPVPSTDTATTQAGIVETVTAESEPTVTTTVSTTSPDTAVDVSTAATDATDATDATTDSTTTGGTATGTTTPADDSSGTDTDNKHQRLLEWLAALLSAALLATALFLIDRALIAQRQESTKHTAPGWYPASFLEHPVPQFLLLGEDGRWATSKTLASVWTVSLVWAISTIALSDLFGATGGWNAFKDQAVSWQYLLLLGGPVGAAIGAQALTLVRSQSGSEVKTAPPEGASFSQLYSDDWGKLDLIDVQYLTFNVLSILVFLVVFIADASAGLPVFPGVLATLTAATAAAYLARRAALRADPVITSISPPAAAPGEIVRMWGVNLTPAKEAKSVEAS